MSVKILTTDDSKTVRIIVNKAFKSFDCQIVEAANGVEGLAAAAKEQPNIILLDITMPVMDGVEMLTRLKADPALKGIPVIMLTAEGGRDQVLKIAKLGIRDYIVKPFKEDVLIEKVSKVIELKSKSDGPQKVRTIFDPATILVVDDKPAIVQQIQEGLKHTPWKLHGVTATGEAIDFAGKTIPDLVITSLSLPDDGGFTLFRLLRQNPKTKNTPVFGLVVKTETAAQQQAQQVGFSQLITKPIDLSDVETKIIRALNLDTSGRYFAHENGQLIVRFPERATPVTTSEISNYLKAKVSEAVNSGISAAILDLQATQGMDLALIKLLMYTMGIFKDLNMPFALVGNSHVMTECRNFEDTRSWAFHPSLDEARRALSEGRSALLQPTAG